MVARVLAKPHHEPEEGAPTLEKQYLEARRPTCACRGDEQLTFLLGFLDAIKALTLSLIIVDGKGILERAVAHRYSRP
jgi:hypothetical protein